MLSFVLDDNDNIFLSSNKGNNFSRN